MQLKFVSLYVYLFTAEPAKHVPILEPLGQNDRGQIDIRKSLSNTFQNRSIPAAAHCDPKAVPLAPIERTEDDLCCHIDTPKTKATTSRSVDDVCDNARMPRREILQIESHRRRSLP